ncbi:hypothetical protein ScalyP_jg9333 [Parmales sp. scaly parma]|nr:hypothetical protein ScalyP_jg9333 [Parmales sp. scaly parma]
MLRQRKYILSQLRIELTILLGDKYIFLFCIIAQLYHSIATNVVYLMEAKFLSSAQRLPLWDLSYHYLPELHGWLWSVSDILIYCMIASAAVLALLTIPLRPKPSLSHTSPPFATLVLKRFLVTVSVLQSLRIISFTTTLLPGSSHQCLYTVTDEMNSDENLTIDLFTSTSPADGRAADSRGNSVDWAPPQSLSEVLFRVDSSMGCGDLMFSSHTIFAVTTACTIFKYFGSRRNKVGISVALVVLILLTLMSRKHYTIDVFTALYVGPIVYELLWVKFPDCATGGGLKDRYGIVFECDSRNMMSFVVLKEGGERFEVEFQQLPKELKRRKMTDGDEGFIYGALQAGEALGLSDDDEYDMDYNYSDGGGGIGIGRSGSGSSISSAGGGVAQDDSGSGEENNEGEGGLEMI